MILVESDMGAMRAEPPVRLVDAVRGWVEAAFRSAGAEPRPGAGRAAAAPGLDTLEARIAEQVAAHDAVVLGPALVGAWGAAPAAAA